MTFMVPGIVALTVVYAAIAGESTWLNEGLIGIVKEYLVATIPRVNILIGNTISIVTKILIQSIVILTIGVLMGAKVNSNPLKWLGGLILIAGYGIGFSGFAIIGMCIALRTFKKSCGSPYWTLLELFILINPLI